MIHWEEIAQRMNTDRATLQAATAFDQQKLEQFAADGLITYSDEKIQMTESGSPFVRNVAASLDKLMLNSAKTFSKPI